MFNQILTIFVCDTMQSFRCLQYRVYLSVMYLLKQYYEIAIFIGNILAFLFSRFLAFSFSRILVFSHYRILAFSYSQNFAFSQYNCRILVLSHSRDTNLTLSHSHLPEIGIRLKAKLCELNMIEICHHKRVLCTET